MTHREKLLEVYENSNDISDIQDIEGDDVKYLENIVANIDNNKGVFTVLVTLLVHKLMDPQQDIRYFQSKMKNGFSGRSIDTKFITPTLKELGLPSMAESGWLTRSLEQPYPYTLNYEGEISGKDMKISFLKIIDSVQKQPALTESFLRFILSGAIFFREKNKVEIEKLKSSDDYFISVIIDLLEKHFNHNYNTHGGSKLPVIAFHSIYQILVSEVGRYKGCVLEPLGSHTASDRTSKTAGDIQIKKDDKVFEAVEVKLDKAVDITMVRIAYEKIVRFGIERYYILSQLSIVQDEKDQILSEVDQIKSNHGCQLIINGLIPTLKYYLRLISDPKLFLNLYIEGVKNDPELKLVHKSKLKELLEDLEIKN